MSRPKLKFFGFTRDEAQALRRQIHSEPCEVGQGETLTVSPAPEEVWVVHVAAVQAFLAASRGGSPAVPEPQETSGRPPVVLWVPQHKAPPLAFDDWSGTFAIQLEAAREADRATLARISRCVQVLMWGERVAMVPAAWFAALTGSPQRYRDRVDDLPFDAVARQHLHGCGACKEEVLTLLEQRATLRWTFLCPSVEELTAWLEAADDDPVVAAHVMDCGLCRTTGQWLAGVWEREGLIPAPHVYTRLAAVGLMAPSR